MQTTSTGSTVGALLIPMLEIFAAFLIAVLAAGILYRLLLQKVPGFRSGLVYRIILAAGGLIGMYLGFKWFS